MVVEIAVMGAADLARATDWAAAEGWNPGLMDRLAFQAADPQGFLVGRLDGRPVCCISVVRYGADFGFLGFYIAIPEARGKGHGIVVWNAGMAHLAGRNVGLDGVPAQQENYKRSGFHLYWRNVRYQGQLPAGLKGAADVTICDACSLAFPRIAAYDRRFFPTARDAFLSLWMAIPGHVAVAALKGGELAGLAVMRPCRTGFKVGPLYAEDRSIALALLGALAGPASGQQVAIDMPDRNAAAVAMAAELGFQPSFETARMYTGAEPDIDRGGLFGVASLELG
jgi:hypothetical protein